MRLGVLDIGSNSAQFLVVDASRGAPPLPLRALKEPVLLGEDIDAAGVITADGAQRVADAVERVLSEATRYDVDSFYAFVTAAIRDAPNQRAVLDKIEAASGIRPQFLSGVQEARLTYLAVRHWFGWCAGTLLMLDIGGGSMEIALGRDAEPSLALSLPLGAGRLTRAFFAQDPPRRSELELMRRHIRDCLGQVRDRLLWEGTPRHVIGSSKTFKQLARLSGAAPQRHGPFVARTLRRGQVHGSVRKLAAMPAEKRAALRGVSPARASQILAGAMVADATMAALDIDCLEVSPWALREGVVLEHISTRVDSDRTLPLHALELPRHGPESPVSVLPRRM
ncbi:Ppx/GppA phosphatase family protein [Nocardia sp. NPDC051900]|uniref:Ppx/GppA phosphatase family protein n=1 Tax=Nocardia sp. NPDC051900 TaxID=3364326 RepID=UPI0037B3CA4E